MNTNLIILKNKKLIYIIYIINPYFASFLRKLKVYMNTNIKNKKYICNKDAKKMQNVKEEP